MITTESGTHIVNVISQNVLLDHTRTTNKLIRPQHERIGSIAASLARFPGDLDIVGIQEAHKSKGQHNGEVLASQLGYGAGFWVNHNQKQLPDSPRGRSGEYMGLFGAEVQFAEPIELGDNRRALMTVIADVAFVTLHLRSGITTRTARYLQALALDEALNSCENAVIFGDFNEPPISFVAKARDHLSASGFQSVFELTGQHHPATSPIGDYKNIIGKNKRWPVSFVRPSWSIDDILVRGPRIHALGAGVLERVLVDSDAKPRLRLPKEASDHEGIWATLEIK